MRGLYTPITFLAVGEDLRQQKLVADANLLRPIDASEFAKTLKIEKATERRATSADEQKGLIDAQFRDDAASEIKAVYNKAVQNFSDHAQAVRGYIHLLAAKLDFSSLHGQIQGDINQLERYIEQERAELLELHKIYREEDASYERFRGERELTRPPAPPVNPGLYMIDLIILWFVESAINAVFLIPVSPSPAAGFINSVVISSVNVILALLVGFYVTKRVNHPNVFNKIVGIVTVPLTVVGFGAFHYFITQFRAQLEIAAEQERAAEAFVEVSQADLMNRTVAYILEDPFRVPDLLSAVLFLIGVVLAFYAWWKGYHLGDEFPGYTRRFKAREERRKKFQDHRREVFDQAQSIRDRSMEEIDAFIGDIAPTIQVMQSQQAAWSALRKKFEAFRSSCDDALEYSLNKYVSKACEGIRPEAFAANTVMNSDVDLANFDSEFSEIASAVSKAADAAQVAKEEAAGYRVEVREIIEETSADLKAAIGEEVA